MTPKQRALLALERMRGDDAQRARMNFRGFSPDQMELPHGQSGKSRREILQEYEQHERDVQQAIAADDYRMTIGTLVAELAKGGDREFINDVRAAHAKLKAKRGY